MFYRCPVSCFLYLAYSYVPTTCRISGKWSSINGSWERDSKSQSREGHQTHKMDFPTELLEAKKVCERMYQFLERCVCVCVWAIYVSSLCLVLQYAVKKYLYFMTSTSFCDVCCMSVFFTKVQIQPDNHKNRNPINSFFSDIWSNIKLHLQWRFLYV